MHLSDWKEGLWSYVESQYRSGSPLYLAFDARTLAKIYYSKNEIDPKEVDEALSSFNQACMQLYSNSSAVRWGLLASCFQPDESRRSNAICIAAQQILAAEMMIADENYSSDSYYIRYCRLLGREERESQCPIVYSDFEQLWTTLRRELLQLDGSGPQTVTFAKGRGAKNKFRNLPISQSLLDMETLRLISSELPSIAEFDNAEMLFRVRGMGSKLSTRAAKKLATEPLQNAICAQIRSFRLEFVPEISEVLQSDADLTQVETVLLATDLFIDEYQDGFDLGFRLKHKTNLTKEKFEKELAVLIYGCDLIGFQKSGEASWEGFIHDSPLEESTCEFFISQRGDIQFYSEELNTEVLTCDGLPDIFALGRRSISHEEDDKLNTYKKTLRGKLKVEGGICVNRARRFFLRGYPPSRLVSNGLEVLDVEIVRVDELPMSWADAKSYLAERNENFIVRIGFEDDFIQLEFGQKYSSHSPLLGHKIGSNQIELIPSILEVDDPSYALLQFRNFLRDSDCLEISQKEWLIFSNFPDEYWAPLDRASIKRLDSAIKQSGPSFELLRNKMRVTGMAPSPLVRLLRHSI